MRRYQFQFSLWPTLAALSGVLLMLGLGQWQWQRGQAKQALIDQHARAAQAAPLLLQSALPASTSVQSVVVDGHYSAAPAILLDNQSHARQPGVLVLNAFVLAADGSRVLVNRGWVPLANGEPPDVPPPSHTGNQRLQGYWHSLPKAGMQLGGPSKLCEVGNARPKAVNYPSLGDLRCLLGGAAPLRDGLLDLSPDAADGFVREVGSAAAEAVPPSRHYGYAAQWWAFAATLAVIYLRLSFRKKSSSAS